jgi:hypothetical protein
MSRLGILLASTVLSLTSIAASASNVITDWDEKGTAVIQGFAPVAPRIGASGSTRIMAIMHLAMFEAVNAIDQKYEGYKLHPESADKTKQYLDAYLAAIPASEAKDRGIKLGEGAAAKVIALRADDGVDKRNAYRPRTTPGVYVQTMPTVSWEFSDMPPFVMTSPSQFRPGPPPELKGEQWAKDYNEISDLGERNSTKRTPKQTEDAKFWISGGATMYHQFIRQVAIKKDMSVVETARFMSVVTMAEVDATIAVFDAKYKYEFWRPITAIRNGDIDDNPATERVAAWQPLDVTPTHPEYPCAHCIVSGAVAGSIETLLGTSDIPEVSLISPSAPGVTHKFTNVRQLNEEIASARIYAGFHYRNSTVVGSDMGMKIGAYVVQNSMPLKVAAK